MKKAYFLLIIILIGLSFTAKDSPKESALPERFNGIYLYHFSQPINEYNTLGIIKLGLVWSAKPADLKNTIVNKARKKYPDCEGAIISDDMGNIECIKFK